MIHHQTDVLAKVTMILATATRGEADTPPAEAARKKIGSANFSDKHDQPTKALRRPERR
jgi:hypothetical protein